MKKGLFIALLLAAFGFASNAQTKQETVKELPNGNTVKKVDVEHNGRKGKRAVVYNQNGDVVKKGKGKKGRNGAKRGKKVRYNEDGSVVGKRGIKRQSGDYVKQKDKKRKNGHKKGRAVMKKGDKKVKKHRRKRG